MEARNGSYAVPVLMGACVFALGAIVAYSMVRMDYEYGVLNEDLNLHGGCGDHFSLHRNIVRRNSPIHGGGLFVTSKIYKGEIVWFDALSGGFLSRVLNETLPAIPIVDLQEGSEFHKAVVHFQVQMTDTTWEAVEGATDMDELKQVTDADASYFMNHSCAPTATFLHDASRMSAVCDLDIGDEVTFDYATQDSTHFTWMPDGMQCLCGSERCRKFVKHDDWKFLCNRHPTSAFAPYLQKRIERWRSETGGASSGWNVNAFLRTKACNLMRNAL